MTMIFSQRYRRAIEARQLNIDVDNDVRRKVRSCIEKHDHTIRVRRERFDNWEANSSVIEEAVLELVSEHGWDDVPGTTSFENGKYYDAFRRVVLDLDAAIAFDLVELCLSHMEPEAKEECRVKINSIFDLHGEPWRISDGEFFKIDADFMGERLAATAHDALSAHLFVGAAQEYAKARRELSSGETKNSIVEAEKSFESVMKVMTGRQQGNADQLIKELVTQSYFDDLPEDIRAGFAEQVMKALPFIRNRLAGHGQGASIVDVPAAYGELAIQIAAAFHNFLVSKHLERRPPQTANAKPTSDLLDDDIPF